MQHLTDTPAHVHKMHKCAQCTHAHVPSRMTGDWSKDKRALPLRPSFGSCMRR
jgi:hypothetical protein